MYGVSSLWSYPGNFIVYLNLYSSVIKHLIVIKLVLQLFQANTKDTIDSKILLIVYYLVEKPKFTRDFVQISQNVFFEPTITTKKKLQLINMILIVKFKS